MQTTMDCLYIVIYRFEGIAPGNPPQDRTVYQDHKAGTSVALTSDVNAHTFILDQGLAISNLILRGLFHGEDIGEIEPALEQEVDAIQYERTSKFKNAVYAVITIKDRALLNVEEGRIAEKENFSVCLEFPGSL